MAMKIDLQTSVDELVHAYATPLLPPPPEEGIETVKVDRAMSRIAFVYEKVRNAVEYRETHLLRRAAIARILRRRLHAGVDIKEVSSALLRELIRAQYLPNATYPIEVVGEIATILQNYHHLHESIGRFAKGKELRELRSYIIELVSSSVEAYLVPPLHVEALVATALETYKGVIEIRGETLEEAELEEQLYIAVHQVLPKSDVNVIRYQLFRLYLPSWVDTDVIPQGDIDRVAAGLSARRQQIEDMLVHPVQDRLQRKLRRQIAPFVVLRALLEKHGARAREIMEDPEVYEPEIRLVTQELYGGVKNRIRRSAVRSIIYLFLTKIFVGVAAELPYDLYVVGEIHPLPLIINVLFPPFLVFLIALWIRLPGEGNTQKIIQRLWGITYGAHGGEWRIQVRPPAKRRGFAAFWFVFSYVLSLFIVYGGSAWLLRTYLGFNLASTFIFLLFLSLVSFFGYRIRQAVRELLLATRKEGVIALLFDFISIPLLRVGRFLSIHFSRLNVLAFVLDVILEAPFKTIVDFFEDWISYMREKREEIT